MENTNLCRSEIFEKLVYNHAFRGTHTSEIEVNEPIEIDTDENLLKVICTTKSGHSFESEFELDTTINGFEIGEYIFIE